MRRLLHPLALTVFAFGSTIVNAQLPVYPNPLAGICDAPVPHFNIDLTGVPDSVWVSPNVNREETCCGDPGTGNWTFVSFTATLDPNVAEVAVGLSPSDPGGASSGYWIDACGTWGDRIEGGTEVCITGPGTHNFWYGKSGGNANSSYTIVQIPKPTFPDDDSVRIGCSLPLDIYGLSGITMTSGNPTYDSWLDMTDPSHPVFTPGTTAPASIDFTITGTQIASASCGAYATTDVVTISIYQPLDVTISPDPSNFCEGGNVVLTANVSNGVGTVFYSWIDNSTNTEISTTASTPAISTTGNYTIYISDILNRYGCAPIGITQSVSETLAPDIFAGEDDTVCSTSPSALLVATLDNPGTGVLWTSPTGGTFSDATSLAPIYTASAADLINGSVDLTVTAFGCQDASDIVTIVFDAGPGYTVNTPSLLCYESTGLVSVNVTSGGLSPWAPISYYWSFNGLSGPSSVTLGAGTYSVTVVNQYGCGSNTPFTLTAPPALTLVMSNTDATPTGTATGVVGGGTPGYTYSWENSIGTFMGNTSTIVGLPTDYYVLTATDFNGCIISSSTVVNDPLCSGFNASATGIDATCFSGSDGSATVTGTGGAGSTGPYSYIWMVTPSQTTITATGLSAGVYEVIVSDLLLGCRDVAIAVVGEPAQITNTMTHTDNIEIGGTIGTATANPAGGTSPYTYSWSTAPVQTTQTATGLTADTYTVTITDNNSCAINDEVIINEPPCDNFQAAVTVTNVSCNGDLDGSANVVVVHGTAPYTYSLDGGAYVLNPGANFSGLAGGAHTLSIMDAQKCVVIQNFSVVEPSALSIGLNPTNMSCFSEPENGTIDLTVSGGTFPYDFEWINNDGNIQIATTEDIINLGVGTYSVTVTDDHGCEAQSSIGIDQPAELIAAYAITDITCFGADNGAIDVTVSGGQTPYDYDWVFSGGTSTSEDLATLTPGQYILTVTDGNNCSTSNIVDVYMNEPSLVEIFSTLIYCPTPGDATTLVEVDSISGGTDGPYQLSFNGGALLAAGVYTTTLGINATHTVTAVDANGCTVTAPTSIVINPAVVISNVTFNPCIPAAATNIDITVTPTGGDGGPYQVSTDNGNTYAAAGTYILSVPVGALYEVVISDGLLCESLPFSISVPFEITTGFVVDSVECLNGTDGSILFSASGGTAPYNVSWTGPVIGNPVGNEIALSGGTYTISSLSEGNYSVTVTDFNGCTKLTSISVGTTVDLIDPTISCPGTISTNSDLNNCFAAVTYGIPVGTDNCPGSITTQTAGLASGSNFPVGTTANSFLVTDAQGRTATCSFDITVTDAQLPSITCPADVAVDSDAGDCFADATSVTLGAPITADNCGVTPATNNAPVTYSVGTTTVVWTVIDIHGNSNTCNQLVVVTDNEDPTITCPADVAVDSDAGECFATSVSLGVPTTNDNCGVATTTNNAPSLYPVGTTTVTWTVTDIHGNTFTCDQDVVVTDNEDPAITCPTDVAVDSDAGLCEATTVSLGTPNTNDNCGIATVTNNAPATYLVGTTTVTWTVTDIHGNTITCDQDVVVTDNENPTITCPADVAVDSDAGLCEATTVSLGTPTTNDNCGVATVTNNAPATYLVGTTTVTWTVTDIHGNSFTCDQDVVVTDNENPIVTCPSDITVSNDNGFCSALINYNVPFSDNCSGSSIVQTAGLPSGATFPIGTTNNVFLVTDAAANITSCSFNITVIDTTLPVIICSPDIIVDNTSGSCEAVVTFNAATAQSGCASDCVTTLPADAGTYLGSFDGHHYMLSSVDTDWNNANTIATNLGGQLVSINSSAENTFLNSVLTSGSPWTGGFQNPSNPGYNEPGGGWEWLDGSPFLYSNWNIGEPNNGGAGNEQNIQFLSGGGSWNDNNGIFSYPYIVEFSCPVMVVQTAGLPSGSNFPVGNTTVSYTAYNANGGNTTCSFTITVNDTEAPIVICPSNVFATADPLECAVDSANVSLGIPVTSDNCGIASITNDAPAAFPVGTTTVTWTVTDVNGNSTTCTQDIVVTDNEDPTIICPSDVVVSNTPGQCWVVATSIPLGTPATNDNCGVMSLTNNFNDFQTAGVIPVGTYTVIWTVTDFSGNTATCSQNLTIEDNEDPTMTCPADVAVDSDSGLCEATTVSLGTPTTNDNCAVATVTNNAPATYLVGTTTVTWTVTDIHGNSITCDQDVVVTDNEDPTITCPADVAVDSDAGLCEAATVSLGTPVTNDNCGVATVTNNAPSTYPVGTTIVTWTVTDVNGNFVTCAQNVVVTDNENPAIICPANVAVNNDPALCSASSVSLGTPVTSDNCGVATVTNNAPSVFNVGTTIVTWTVTDIHGNSSTCDQDVVVTDNELPVTTDCPADINTCFPTVTYSAPTATDNCGVSTIVMTAGLGSGATFPLGTTTEEYTITDINGNVTVCSFDVTIYPTPVASFIATNVTCYNSANGTIDLTVTDGTFPYSFDWSNGETTEDLTNLVPAIYTVVVTDANGCETTTAFAISQPDTITISETHTDVSCNGLSDGSVSIIVDGGVTPYTFDWSNGSPDQDLTLLPAGTYDLTLTDSNGCTYQLSVDITQPDTLAASATTLDATCLSTDGTLDLTVEGGTEPYTYLWSNSATSQDLNDVIAGTYLVMITDANGCQFEFEDSILSTNPIGINANVQDALCYGDRNGLIDITVTNAIEPISYLWSTGDTSAVIINVLAGDYTVTVTDSNQCTLTVTYTIEQPDSLYIELYSPTFSGDYNVSSYLGTDGSIETIVTGGTSPYEFLWSDGSTTQDLFNLPAGNYAVLVTDENGCTVQADIILTSPWELEMPTGYSPNGDGQNDFFVVHGIEVFPDNEITVYNRWGNVVYSATGYQNEWNGFNNSGEELPDGTYFVVLKVAGLDEPLTGYVDLRRKH